MHLDTLKAGQLGLQHLRTGGTPSGALAQSNAPARNAWQRPTPLPMLYEAATTASRCWAAGPVPCMWACSAQRSPKCVPLSQVVCGEGRARPYGRSSPSRKS